MPINFNLHSVSDIKVNENLRKHKLLLFTLIQSVNT